MEKQIILKKMTLLIVVLLWGMTGGVKAQTKFTVGATGADYTTIAAAYAAIPTAMTLGAYVIELQNNYDPTTETYPISLGSKTGASAINTITIKPATGAKITIGPADKTVTATVTGSTFTSATTSVDLSTLSYSGNISYLSGNVTASDITITTTAGSATATITSGAGTLTNGITYYVSGNANIPARRTFTYNGSTTVTLSSATSVTAGTDVTSKATPNTNSFVSGIGTYITLDFYNVSSISGSTITVPSGTFIANSINNNKLYVGPVQTKAFYFNGANYVTIDGVSRTDANTGLTIQNPNLIYASTIYFNSGTNNTVKNCIIKGANQTGSHNNGYCGEVYFNDGTYNTITQNDICDMTGYPTPICMVTFNNGSANNTVSYNNMYNVGTEFSPNGNAGFFQFPLSLSGSNNKILNNNIYWTKAVKFYATISLIGMSGSMTGLGHRIENNVIGYGAADRSTRASLTALSTALTISAITARNATIVNNTIAGINASFKTLYGVQITQHAAGSTVTGDTYCYGNQVKDITLTATASGGLLIGIENNAATSLTNTSTALNIKNNTVNNLSVGFSSSTSNTCTIAGISPAGTITASSNPFNYINNQVSSLTAGTNSSGTNGVTGIKTGANANLLEKNLVYNLNVIGGTSSFVFGLNPTGSNAGGATLQNNMIRLGTDVTTDAGIYGLYISAATTADQNMKIYYNTVFVGGTASAATPTKPTFAFYRTGATKHNYDVRNNIIYNQRTKKGSTDKHYALSVVAATDLNTCNNNIYQFSGSFGALGTTDTYAALSNWQSASGNDNTNSSVSSDPGFMDPTAAAPDLRIKANTTVVDNVGADLSASVSDDYDGKLRSSFTPHDIGAFAYTYSASASLATDHFRTLTSGNWRTNATWESSANGSSNWITATAFPSATANSIVIQNGHTVTATAEATASTLTVNGGGKLTLNDRVGLTATSLNLESHATNGTATFVDGNATGGLTVSGTTTVKQNLTIGRNWYISNPVAATTLPTVAAGTRTLHKYDESIVSDAAGATGWVANPASVEVGKGYVASVSVTGDLTFTGALNTGNKDITLTSRTGTSNKAGFNLVGNPYPSYIDWVAVMAANSTKLRSTTMWYRSKVLNEQEELVYSFLTVNGDGVGVPITTSSKIPPMQSFWVRAVEGVSEPIVVTNEMRSHAPVTDKLLKAPAANNRVLVRLKVSNGVNSDEAVVYFSENAKDGFDINDAPKMSNGNAAIPEIYTTLNNEKIVINSMNSMPLNQEIKLGFVAGNAASFSLKANEITNMPEGVKVILKDNATKAETDLTDGVTAYQFAPEVTSTDRFSLIFRTVGSSTDVQNPNGTVAQVYVNGNNQITIIALEKSNYGIYNAVGQLIENGILNYKLNTVNYKLNTGVYVVKVGNQSNRVIIK